MLKKVKGICNIFCVIIAISAFCMIAFMLWQHGKYDFSYADDSSYFAVANGELLELTENGTIYLYGRTKEREVLVENSDIIFMDVFSWQGGNYILLTHKDGRIGVCQSLFRKEWEIARVAGAVKAGMQLTGLMVLTGDGAIYEYEAPDFMEWILRGKNIKLPLWKNEDLPECKDSCLAEENRVLLTKNGEVIIKGKLYLEKYDVYEKMECPAVIDKVYHADSTVLALSIDGHLYEAGMDLIVPPFSSRRLVLIPEYEDVTFWCANTGWERMVFADTASNVYYHYLVDNGKASGVSRKKKIRNRKNVKEVFLYGDYLYILEENCLYIREVS